MIHNAIHNFLIIKFDKKIEDALSLNRIKYLILDSKFHEKN